MCSERRWRGASFCRRATSVRHLRNPVRGSVMVRTSCEEIMYGLQSYISTSLMPSYVVSLAMLPRSPGRHDSAGVASRRVLSTCIPHRRPPCNQFSLFTPRSLFTIQAIFKHSILRVPGALHMPDMTYDCVRCQRYSALAHPPPHPRVLWLPPGIPRHPHP